MLAIGMDVHKSVITAHAVPLHEEDEESRMLAEEFNLKFRKFKAVNTEYEKVTEFLEEAEHCILIENSTKSHEVFWTLTDLDCTVMVAYSTDLYRITKSVKKTDAYDCIELAHYMRRKLLGENEFSVCYIVDQKWMNRRQLCRIYSKESDFLSDTRRQIRSFITLRGISLKNNCRDITAKKSIEELEMTADDSLKLLIDRAKTVKKRMKSCEEAILREFKDDGYFTRIYTIPGFGIMTSAYVSSMIIDIERFDTPNQFSAYFGITPKQRDSGDSAVKCGITRRGDEILRKMLLQATFVHISHDKDRNSPVSRMYDRKIKEGMPHKKAITACANKMTKILFAVLKKGEDYRF